MTMNDNQVSELWTSSMTLEERRKVAWAECNEITSREYKKYLEATNPARDKLFATLKAIDAEADEIIRRHLPTGSPQKDQP